jgi:Trypsin-like peptidase domain
MSNLDTAKTLLASCSARVDTDSATAGTAFFVAPEYAITAAHVVGGAVGLAVRLVEGPDCWPGHVADVHPRTGELPAAGVPYPAPDLALIRIGDGVEHGCALLGELTLHSRVLTRGYTLRFPADGPTAETERFRLSGDLETPCPGCTLLKLGGGEVTLGMSGAPVLDLSTEVVIGMLRTSRKLDSDLGGWVVPARVIREAWPEVAAAHDLFHDRDPRWRNRTAKLTRRREGTGRSAGTPLIGKARIGNATFIAGNVGAVNMNNYGVSEDGSPQGGR